MPIPVNANMVGEGRYYQVIFRDPADSTGLGLTSGVCVEFWD